MPFSAIWMDLEIIILRQRKTNIIWYHLYVEFNLEKRYKWTYLQNRSKLINIENKHAYHRGNVAGRERPGTWDKHVHTAVYKIDNPARSYCSAQGTLPNTLRWPLWEKNLKKSECVCLCNWVTLLYTWR